MNLQLYNDERRVFEMTFYIFADSEGGVDAVISPIDLRKEQPDISIYAIISTESLPTLCYLARGCEIPVEELVKLKEPMLCKHSA